jgi:hypothetical protein
VVGKVVVNTILVEVVVQAVQVLTQQINQMVVLENFLQSLVLIYIGAVEVVELLILLAAVVTEALVVEAVGQ